ncbi:MAG TPA: hypothetical protein HPP54_04190 [Nitrospinae bacterium]|nr:hypothetical protein [Nitrospinota bacterium]
MAKKTAETKPTKLRQASVQVYLDEETKIRFNLGVRAEQDKQIKKGETPTISKSNICEDLIKKWLDKNEY